MTLAAVLGLCGYAVVTGGGAGGAGAFDGSAVATPGTTTGVAPA
ncbi:hypothetical protein N136_04473, partial [Leifsonia aquatica ATCC 14665]